VTKFVGPSATPTRIMAQPLSIPRDVRSESTDLTEFLESLGHVSNLAQHMSSEDSFS
jgi:hypothetical protein